MKVLNPVETRERVTTVLIDRNSLAQLIADAVRNEIGLHPGEGEVKVHIERDTEGSPPYTVGHSARVTVVEKI